MFRRQHYACLMIASFFVAGVFAQAAPNPELTDQEFADLIKLIDDSQDTVVGLVSGLTDEQWNFKQNPDRWSVAECVEHIARGEKNLLERIEQMIASPLDPDWFSKTDGTLAVIRQLVPNRGSQGQGGVKAPGELVPDQHWDRQRGMEEFYAAHGATRAFVETMDRAIKDRTMESTVPQFGWMNAHDWLNLLVLHVVRHSKQIAEVKEAENFPKTPATSTAKGPNPNITEEELATLRQDISNAEDTLLGLISGMTDEQWAFRENPDRWSVGECVEHIAQADILDGIVYTMTRPANPNWYEQTKGKLQDVRETVTNRPKGGAGSPFKAPGEVAPTGTWDRARGIQEFYKTVGRIRGFLQNDPRDLKTYTFDNPFPQIGTLNCHQWLTLMTMHALRHSKQIAEVQADLNYPK